MPQTSKQFGLAYFSIPKVASTSIKRALFELETGKIFKPEQNGGRRIHDVYHTKPLAQRDYEKIADFWKFAVVRDPIKRIISTYANRVLFHKDLESANFAKMRARLFRLSTQPDLEEFCVNIRRYRWLSPEIRHHTDSIESFVGPDLSRLDKVYRIEELDILARDISLRVGKTVRFEKLQTGGPKIGPSDLTPKALSALKLFTKSDYRLLVGLYEPEQSEPS